MTRKNDKPIQAPECSLCSQQEGKLFPCEGGYICQDCMDRGRKGRDTTTRAARALRQGMLQQGTANRCREDGGGAEAICYQEAAIDCAEKADVLYQPATPPQLMAGGEAVPERPRGIVNSLKVPNVAALEASAHRLELLDRMGLDCAAMALDAADSIQAENSLERMLAHQLAAAHKAALQQIDKATFAADTGDKLRLLNAAARMMGTFQNGLLTLHRIRSNGDQRITIQHVTVADGGQAVIGAVNRGGGGK